jgi:hypothetical protein
MVPSDAQVVARLKAVLDLCDQAEHGALRWRHPLPVPEWVSRVRAAAMGIPETDPDPQSLAEMLAEKNMRVFLLEIRAAGVDATDYFRESESQYKSGDPNYFCYGVKVAAGYVIQVQMPGVPLDLVRFTGESGQNMTDFRQLCIDGSWWYWKYAVNRCLPRED